MTDLGPRLEKKNHTIHPCLEIISQECIISLERTSLLKLVRNEDFFFVDERVFSLLNSGSSLCPDVHQSRVSGGGGRAATREAAADG